MYALCNVSSRESWLGGRISSLQCRMEISGATERNDAKNINSINNIIVHVVQMT